MVNATLHDHTWVFIVLQIASSILILCLSFTTVELLCSRPGFHEVHIQAIFSDTTVEVFNNYCGCHNNLDATHIYRCLHPLQIDFILHTFGAQSVLLHMEGCPFRDTRTQLYVEVCNLLQLYCLNVCIEYTLFSYTQFALQRNGPQPGLLANCMLLINCAVLSNSHAGFDKSVGWHTKRA